MANKMILKHFLPLLITGGVLTPAILGYVSKTVSDNIKTEKKININTSLLSLISLYGIALFWVFVVTSYQSSKKFASHATREYVKEIIKEYPELKYFRQTFSNQQAMYNLATFICNSLRPSEQKLVKETVLDMNKRLSLQKNKEDEIAVIKEALNKVIDIVKGHAAVHPEFVAQIYSEIVFADTTYVLSNQQQNIM